MKVNLGVRNEKEAKIYYSEKINFCGVKSLFLGGDWDEEEVIFSHAISKFQDLVIFEE